MSCRGWYTTHKIVGTDPRMNDRPWVTYRRPVFLNDGVYAVADGGWVGLIRYVRRGQPKQWRTADPSEGAARTRHEAYIRLAKWIGCTIVSTRFSRGIMVFGTIQWETAS